MGLRPGRAVVLLCFFVIAGTRTSTALEISGRVQVEPPYPEAKIIKVRKKTQDSCAEEQISKALLVSPEGGLVNAVLWLEGEFSAEGGSASGGPAQPPSQPFVTLDQAGCNFEPHVVLIPPGGRVKILNSDPLAHDVRAFESAHMLFRLDMDTQAKPEERVFEKPGIYTLRCGLHPWMHAFAVQAAHDFYAVTGADGTFALKHIPAGKQTLHIWHETLGEVTMPLEVAGSVQDFSYTFSAKSRGGSAVLGGGKNTVSSTV